MNDSGQQPFALVTGGGSGLGRAFCLKLAHEGWYVVVADIDEAAARATLATIVASEGRGEAERLDVADFQSWSRLQQKLRETLPRLDLLINNAGVCAAGEVGSAPIDDFLHVATINLHGTFFGCHVMAPWLKETAPGGHIVNVASIFGVIAPPTMAAYNLSKAGVISLSETLYGELDPYGIGVTVVVPGFFPTSLLEKGRFDENSQLQIAQYFMQRTKTSTEDVVQQTLVAVRRKQLYVVLGTKARWLWRLKRWIPTRLIGAVAIRYRQLTRRHDTTEKARTGSSSGDTGLDRSY